jgi:hypothetical protein
MAKSALSGLTFTQLALPKWSRDLDPVQARRDKIIAKLNEQLALLADPNFQRTVRKKGGVEVQKKVSKWFVTSPDGISNTFFVRFGHKPLEFEKGKAGITCAPDKLPDVIDLIIAAVKSGELDAQLAANSADIRKKIAKKKSTTAKAA